MARLHLVVGPVGAGKSTFAARLCRDRGALGFNLDEWMSTLFGADPRPVQGRIEWYLERTERCIEQIWTHTQELVALDQDVVLELGLIQRDARHRFYERVDMHGIELSVYVLDAPFEVRWERVERRNRERGTTFFVEVPREFFELASRLWEPPDDAERAERQVLDISPPE